MASDASPTSDPTTSSPTPERPDLSEGERASAETGRTVLVRRIGLGAGLIAALLIYLVMPADVPHAAKLTAATAEIGRAHV